MKQKDVALLIAVVAVAAVASLLVTNMVFVTAKSKQQSAQKVEPINSNFTAPDGTVFNAEAVNPTRLIKIGDEAAN